MSNLSKRIPKQKAANVSSVYRISWWSTENSTIRTNTPSLTDGARRTGYSSRRTEKSCIPARYQNLQSGGLPQRMVHSLWHTNITMQIAAGVSLITGAGRAGHARTGTTTDIYSRFLKSSDRTPAEKIEKLFNKNKTGRWPYGHRPALYFDSNYSLDAQFIDLVR